VGLRWFVNAHSNHSIQRGGGEGTVLAILFTKPRRHARKLKRGIDSQDARGSIPENQGDGFASQIGWGHEGGHVALHIVTSWAQLCCVGNKQ
jgi:hypothetical protein